jgi:hypothetical protein
MSSAKPRRDGQFRHGSARPTTYGHHRQPKPGEVALGNLALNSSARLTLALMRWHFQTFANPESHGWLMAMRVAAAHVGPDLAGALCCDVVKLIQSLRGARSSAFLFNSEGCACCRIWATADERRLMEFLEAICQGQQGRARIMAQLLCDGACHEGLIAAAQDFATRHLQPRAVATRNTPA